MGYDRGKRLGLLVPAGNSTMEEDFAGWMPKGVVLHTMRMYRPPEQPASMAEGLQTMDDHVDESARLLALARPDVIAFGCTSGSFLHGLGWDQQIVKRIEAASGGTKTIATARTVIDALNELGAKKIGACSPYPEDINVRLRKFLADAGFEVVSFDYVDGYSLGGIDNLEPEVAYDLGKRVDRPEAEAVFISCTAFRVAPIIERLEQEIGKPVVASNQATFWACLRALDVKESILGAGQLLRERIAA